MLGPFRFDGRMRRPSYALGTLCAFFSQHLVTVLMFKAHGWHLTLDWRFLIMPQRSLGTHWLASNATLIFALACLLMVAWVLAALTFRRAADADISPWIAVFAIAPIVQIPAMLWLYAAPSRPVGTDVAVAGDGSADWVAAAQGVIAGAGLTVLSVAVGALLFGSYGFGMFVAAPFVTGAIAAYFANRNADVGAGWTAKLVASGTLLGGVLLVVTALEGIVCIMLAAPLWIGVALVGGVLGQAIAIGAKRPPRQTLSSVALLPLIFAVENVLPASTQFETSASIEISAQPETVWRALVTIDLSNEPVSLPFRLGIAYPIRGEVLGEAAGAVRVGEFSTGLAREQVVEWVPNRKLAFVVVDDVPAMRELSPYATVHAPHVVGYFHTKQTSFELVPRADGGTRVIAGTSHELRLDPVYYWLPLARWVVRENNARVLAHIKRHAERRAVGAR